MNILIKELHLYLVSANCGGIRAALEVYLENALRRVGLTVQSLNYKRGKTAPVCGLPQLLNAEAFANHEAETFASGDSAATGEDENATGNQSLKAGAMDSLCLFFEFLALSSMATRETQQRWINSRTMIEVLALRSLLEIHAEAFGDMLSSGITKAKPEPPSGLPECLR